MASCGGGAARQAEVRPGEGFMPKTVVVLPIQNQSQDITEPVLIRYFLEEELRSKGFNLISRFNEVDRGLREMGIANGAPITDNDLQNIGQFFKVDGVAYGTLVESSHRAGVKTIRASFRLVSVLSGQVVWDRQIETEEKISGKIPVKGTVTTDLTLKEARGIARSKAGKIPRKVVKDALKTLRR